MNVTIKKEKQVSEDVLNFLIDESFKLFVNLYHIDTDNILVLKRLKDELTLSYKCDILDNSFYTAYLGDELVAVASINKDNYFQDLFVKSKYQNLGIGGMLFDKVVSDNKRKKEITMTVNPKYLEFFKKHSFEVVSEEDKSIRMKGPIKK